MYDLKMCVACFATDVKLFNMDTKQLWQDYQLITGIWKHDSIGLPDYLCYQCAAMVHKYKTFRNQCHGAHFTFQEILNRNKQLNKNIFIHFDRKSINVSPPLTYMSLDKHKYEQVKFQWTNPNRLGPYKNPNDDPIPIAHHAIINYNNLFEDIANEVDEKDIKSDTEEGPDNAKKNIEIVVESTSQIEDDHFMDNDHTFDNDPGPDFVLGNQNGVCKVEEADGSNLDEEYAVMVPISMKEARAAIEVYKMFSVGKYKCPSCNKAYHNVQRMKAHLRMHDQHVSGNFQCVLCNVYYKTDFLLKTHMTEKHMYKYLCRKCPEVSFDRTSAKQHYIWTHLQKGSKKDANWYETRPTWLSPKGGKRTKGVVSLRPVRKMKKLPDDFLVYSPISQEEQYAIVQDRQKSRNYREARYQCDLCFRGYRVHSTYATHMQKHNPEISGKLQCDMCKLYFHNQRKLYKHMNISHLGKFTCQMCSYICYNKGQAQSHYRWHKNVTYDCPHCKKEFMKASTRLTHIRIKHPSMYICKICGHSFVSDTGLYFHKQIKHNKEEIEQSENMILNKSDPLYCADCDIQFINETAFNTHLGSSYKHVTINLSTKPNRRPDKPDEPVRRPGRPRGRGVSSEILNNGVTTSHNCEVCNQFLSNDVQARKHYEAEHPDTDFLKRYMCDVCGHTTRQYANLIVHMRTHTNEKPYGCPMCPRRFNMPSNRDRHLVVHTGEKKYQCQHCSRRFTQSSAVKLHIQTVHLKIPYAPWNKKNRKRRKELEAASISTAACLPPPPQAKISYDTPGDYLNAYITYNDE